MIKKIPKLKPADEKKAEEDPYKFWNLDRSECCKYLRVSGQTLTRLVQGEGLPVVRISKKIWIFQRREVDRWLKEREASNA